MDNELNYDVAHLGHVEILTPEPEESEPEHAHGLPAQAGDEREDRPTAINSGGHPPRSSPCSRVSSPSRVP